MELIFGYGSIISRESRQSSGCNNPARVARLRSSFGYVRAWNFRKDTGFTALGLRHVGEGSAKPVCGVLFEVQDELAVLDEREAGYFRVQIPHDHIALDSSTAPAPGGEDTSPWEEMLRSGAARAWTYVPSAPCTAEADHDYPICQTYVDAVLGGCLECGGEDMANEFVLTTEGWSEFFLNDVPMGRRPWLHRAKNYATIDSVLEAHDKTHYGMRCHPEEFGSLSEGKLSGMWNVPRRNPLFIGRKN